MKYSVNCHTTQEAGNRLLLTLTYRLLRLRLSEYKSLSVIYIYKCTYLSVWANINFFQGIIEQYNGLIRRRSSGKTIE